jgi:long-chain acyl-CoA synthetase
MARSDTIGGMFLENARRFGAGRVMQMERKKDGWHQYTWADVETIVRETAMGLIELGLEEGDRVAIMAETSPQWTWVDLATASARGVLVTVYPTNTAGQMAYIAKDSGAKMLVVQGASELAKYREVARELPDVRRVIVIDPLVDGGEDHILTLDRIREFGRSGAHDERLEERLDAVKPSDLLTLIYTSGTTGNPKGVMLTHANLMSNVRAVLSVAPIRDDDLDLAFLPLSHSLERMAMYTMMAAGLTSAFAEDISRLVQNMQEVRPTVMVAVPRIYEKMYGRIVDSVESGSNTKKKIFEWALGVGRQVSALQIAKRPIPIALSLQYKLAYRLVFSKLVERMGGRLRFFISGGAPLAQELAEFFHAAGILICEGYGLTETSPVTNLNTPDHVKFGTVGRALPGVEVRLAGDGEILVRGPNVMTGYYNMPEATAEVMGPDGWFHTGDIGEIDADGFLRITDRKKDIIVTAGGKNVAPQNIENLLKMEKYIEQVCVIGDKRKYLTALVVPSFEQLRDWAAQNGASVDDREALVKAPEVRALIQRAIDNVNTQLARFETIKRFELLPEEFTVENELLTPSLKVRRKQVMHRYRDDIAALYPEE